MGWLAFGGNITHRGNWIDVKITNGAKSRVYIAPLGLWLTLTAGTFNSVSYNVKSGDVSVLLDKADDYTPEAFLNIQQIARVKGSGTYTLSKSVQKARGAYIVHLSDSVTTINLTRSR